MDDTVCRQQAIDAFYHIRCKLQMMDDTQTADKMLHGLWLAEREIKALPSAQPERKRGKWILCTDERFDIDYYKCSKCGYEPYRKMDISNFCPNCGADMREGQDEHNH